MMADKAPFLRKHILRVSILLYSSPRRRRRLGTLILLMQGNTINYCICSSASRVTTYWIIRILGVC